MNKVFEMSFQGVFLALVKKATGKGKTEEDVLNLTSWMSGYTHEEIKNFSGNYGDFFKGAPNYNEYRKNIKGKVCGVDINSIEDDTMREIRRLDKLVDELAKGKDVKTIIEKYEKLS